MTKIQIFGNLKIFSDFGYTEYMSTIYVSIPTLEDPEYVNTIDMLIANCSNENKVHIHSAVTSSDKWFKKTKKKLSRYNNITFTKLDPDKHAGVGNGRYYSLSGYNNEDYALQLDAHTNVEKNWDIFLINLYKEAIAYTNNTKVILSCYLGLYEYSNGIKTILDPHPRYACFAPGSKNGKSIIPNWLVLPVTDLPQEHQEQPFIPASMFSGQFAFSDGEFAKNSGVEQHAIFLDEELMQTANLLDMGYSIVYPNIDLPLTHLYHDYEQLEKRQLLTDILKDSRINNDIKNYMAFMLSPNNKDKVERFKRYTGIHPTMGTDKHLQIPKDFNRI